MSLQHLPEVHPVELVPGEDEDMLVGMVVEMDEALADGSGRALEPAGGLAGLLGGNNLDEAAGDEVVEPVGLLDVAVQGRTEVLGEKKDPLDAGVQTEADGDVDEAILAPMGTAGLARSRVSGKRRFPSPPPKITVIT